jgi:prolyl-tRNA synthetase
VPLRLTVGRRTLESGELEAQVRRGREQRSVPLDGAARAAAELWRNLR